MDHQGKRKNSFPLLLEVILILVSCSQVIARPECATYTRCDDCIRQDSNCVWCNDVNVLMEFANDSLSSGRAQLCGTEEEMRARNCRNIINPASSVSKNVASPGSGSSISLTSATVRVRPGQPTSFNVMVSPPQSSAVDMYILLDLTLTMRQHLNNLRSLAGDLVTRMQGLSSDFRIGFGSFVDKPVPPYIDSINRDFPCAKDANLIGITPAECERVYDFRHVLNFTSNVTELETRLNNARLSASLDNPEGILDAVLQAAVCEEDLGWRPRGQSQRIVVAFTDGDYHYALDGKIAGLSSQPSAVECRLDPVTHEYTSAVQYDYPSPALISEALNDNLVTPIFAVPSGLRSVYDGLAAAIRSASVGTLSAISTDIVNLIANEYIKLSGTVVPILTPDRFGNDLNVTLLPVDQCGSGSLREGTSDVCVNVTFPNSVTYAVTVSASPEACRRPQPIRSQIQFIRFGTVTLEIYLECDCNCTANPVQNSPVCNGQGTLECSTCICNDDRIGAACDCPLALGQLDTGCIDPQDQNRVCSGRGMCRCGQCQCNQIRPDSSSVFIGDYCQNDPQDCPQARNNGTMKLCGGNGECMGSECKCNEGYVGVSCECTTSNSSCVGPGQDGRNVSLCSGVGQCICGQCICDDYATNFGGLCEECLPCRTSCSRVSPCVLCESGGRCPEDRQCQVDILPINNTADLPSKEGMKVCSLRDGSCEVRYYISSSIRGDENRIQVFMDLSQSSLATLKQGSNTCNPPPLIWPIFVGIILGTILVGVLVLVLWYSCKLIGEHLEYQQFKRSIDNEVERTGENPLFVDPSSDYQNPRYRPINQ